MFRLTVSLCAIALFSATPSHAKTLRADKGEVQVAVSSDIEGEARRGMEEILDIWRDRKFDALYERAFNSDRHSKEAFINRISNASRTPACCGEKIQDVRVTVKSRDSVEIRARLGLEAAGTGTEFSTKSYRMVKEDGVWKMAMSDILSLAGSPKKPVKAHHKKTR